MRPFHKEAEASLVAFGDVHGGLIPCLARIVLVGSEEERQLHVLSRLAVSLHKRVVVVA